MVNEGIEKLQVTRSLLEMGNRKDSEHRAKNCLKENIQIFRMQLGFASVGMEKEQISLIFSSLIDRSSQRKKEQK